MQKCQLQLTSRGSFQKLSIYGEKKYLSIAFQTWNKNKGFLIADTEKKNLKQIVFKFQTRVLKATPKISFLLTRKWIRTRQEVICDRKE